MFLLMVMVYIFIWAMTKVGESFQAAFQKRRKVFVQCRLFSYMITRYNLSFKMISRVP